MRIAIIGSRGFNNYELLKIKLSPYLGSITKIVSGGAEGADKLGELYAEENNIEKLIFPAEWENFEHPCKIKYNSAGKPYNAMAGFKRNQNIIENCDFVIAFWDGKSSGTKDSMQKANKLRKDILIVYF